MTEHCEISSLLFTRISTKIQRVRLYYEVMNLKLEKKVESYAAGAMLVAAKSTAAGNACFPLKPQIVYHRVTKIQPAKVAPMV